MTDKYSPHKFADSEDSFVCDCRPGYVGLTCEAARDECATNLCDPTGTARCLDLDNRFECECREGFRGEYCEVRSERDALLSYYAAGKWRGGSPFGQMVNL